MPDIKDTVGEGGTNNVHDVALVQAMLRIVKDAKGQPYLGVDYDGVYAPQTKTAIERFQTEQKLLPFAKGAKDAKALVAVGGPTLQKLSAMLPAAYADIRIIAKTKTVYLAATDADAKAGDTAVSGTPNVDPAFRGKAVQAVKQVYQNYKLALTVAPNGGRRTFADQAGIIAKNPNATRVGPGESNHNWGRALDLVFRNFRWVKGDGTIVPDSPYMLKLEQAKGIPTGDELWDARDVPVKAVGLFVIPVTPSFRDRPHVQAWDSNAVNMGNALVTLLNAVSTVRWKNLGAPPKKARQYGADLGLGGNVNVKVGTAYEIWTSQLKFTAADVANAVNQAKVALDDARLIWAGKAVAKPAAFKAITAADVKAVDLTAIQRLLKKSFELADQNFLKWKP